jgi:hypothetical protein
MSKPTLPLSRRLVWVAFAVLFVLHHDFWNWGDRTLVFGVVPIGLAYHIGFSIAAALLWTSAIRWAWPTELEAWADQSQPPESPAKSHS